MRVFNIYVSNQILQLLICNHLTSASQPGCSGTQGCREEASGAGVPPNIEFTTFLLPSVPHNVILAR